MSAALGRGFFFLLLYRFCRCGARQRAGFGKKSLGEKGLQRGGFGGDGGVLLGDSRGGVGAESGEFFGQFFVIHSQDRHGQTVASRASSPSIAPPFIGIPTTGSVVLAANAPARWAAMPAAHKITP